MKSKILLCLFFFSLQVGAEVDCNNLAGSWETRRYDETLESFIVTKSSYLQDKSWHFKQFIDGSINDWTRTESGTWECSGSDFITHSFIVDDIGVETTTFQYKILNLDYNFFRFEVNTENCSEALTDCQGVIFEAIRRNDS